MGWTGREIIIAQVYVEMEQMNYRVFETLEKSGFYFGSLNPGNSLELWKKNLECMEGGPLPSQTQHTYSSSS